MSENQESESDQSNKNPENMKVMPLMEHLDELRSRLVRSFLTVLIFFVIAMFFSNQIVTFLKQPLMDALPEGVKDLHFTGPMDVFLVSMKVSFLASVVAACPVWLYQFWRFVEPALYPGEKKYILPFTGASIALFLGGMGFCYLVILPLALEFLIGMGLEVGTPIITITDYTSLLAVLIFGFGLVFQTPVVLVLLAMLDLVSAKSLSEFRQYVVVIILVIAALLTPPDPMSQLGLAVPMYVMYEISILVIRLIKKKEKNSTEAAS